MQTTSDYPLLAQPPGVPDYQRLREICGLSPKGRAAAEAGLAGTWYGVSLMDDGQCIGMGWIIGDGGCFFQVVDIAVDPAYQGRGLGKRIMAALMEHFHTHAPASAHITLLADSEAHRLYSQFGFALSAPASRGMILRKPEAN